ncbi:peptidase S8/S53 domain-containing protein [Cladorrhinum sp. PSN332]|nr:peptidase S8/S53 domain-containing protein [Cladorrhinum sp. PSN332]
MKFQLALWASLGARSCWSLVIHRDTATSSNNSSGSDNSGVRWILSVKDASTVDAVSDAVVKADPSGSLRIIEKWKDDLFPGLVLESALDQAALAQITGVDGVWKSNKIPRPPPPLVVNGTTTSSHVKARGRIVSQRQNNNSSTIYQAGKYTDALHRMTGVSKLHEEGILGAGVKVAVVDDGFFYNHELLGGGIGPGFKIIGGYDFNPGYEEDEDPRDELILEPGHGTHVVGILAGKNDWYTGVAPEASILAYKIFGRGHEQPEYDTIMNAWKRAFNDGADIISMSVGGPGAFSNSPVNILADRLVERGVVIVVAAGNYGYNGPNYINELCSSVKTLCVGSIESAVKPADPVEFTLTTRDGQSTTTTIGHVSIGEGPVRRTPTDEPFWLSKNSMADYMDLWGIPTPVISLGDACNPLISTEHDPATTVFLIAQGNCGLAEKIRNLYPLNLRYALFYSDGVESLYLPSEPAISEDPRVAYGILEHEAGKALLSVLDAEGTVKVTYNDNTNKPVLAAKNPRGGIANVFSEWGGTNDLFVKPDISAPGGDIFGAYSFLRATENYDEVWPGWMNLNGTSMATPYVAGVAALYLSKYGGRSKNGPEIAQQVVERIRGSGVTVPWGMEAHKGDPRNPNPVPKDAAAPVMHVGTGLINALSVLKSQTRISATPMALNDTANFQPNHEIVIVNGGTEPLTYQLSHDKQLGIEGRTSPTGAIANYISNKVIDLSPGVSFDTGTTVTVPGGQSKSVKVTFSPPTPASETLWPFYNGRILISSSANESLAVAYFGAAFDLKSSAQDLFLEPPTAAIPYDPNPNTGFEFAWPGTGLEETRVTEMEIYYKIIWGSKYLRMDFFEEGWDESKWAWPPEKSEGYLSSATLVGKTTEVHRTNSYGGGGDKRGVGSNSVLWSGGTSKGLIGVGKYHVRFALLRPFGDPAVSSDWSVWKAESLEVLKAPA